MTWLNGQLLLFLGQSLSRVAGAIEPAALTLGAIYVMAWGWLHLSGRIQEPLLDGAKRIAILAAVLGVSLRLWMYNDVLVDTFFNAPAQLAAAILGAPRPLASIDQLWVDAQSVAVALNAQSSILGGHPTFALMALAIYVVVGFTCAYAVFLFALSLLATALLLALGPVFIVLLLFDATRRFFESWLAQLATYGFVSILIALIAALLLSVVRAYATSAVSLGQGVTVSDAVRLCACAGLILLIMRQVLPIAAGLGSGVALSSFNLVSRLIGSTRASAGRSSYQFMRGLLDRETTRYDALSRKAGYYTRQGAVRLVKASWQGSRNLIRRRAQQGAP
ncbi:MAG: type IV secretion system protein [Cyanobacteria bacterium SZAS LIN-2]|nr:type IV secretion system protein [Cyanobacteria bacterium SZAS LIN-2]